MINAQREIIIGNEERIKIGAYQFAVTGNIKQNLEKMKQAIIIAAQKKIRVLVFPECALTGYPPRDIKKSSDVAWNEVEAALLYLQNMAVDYHMYIVAGSIMKEEDNYRNSAVIFNPQGERNYYHKRALWGWDRDNFVIGNESGIISVDGFRVGIRICFEVRFPEFFRELYQEDTDLNIIMFYDVCDTDNIGRYDLIKGHIQTRAVENVTYTLAVNTTGPYQTAPTVLYDRSGRPLLELERNRESMLVFELEKKPLDFGEQGRKEISDWLTYDKRKE